MERLLKWFIVVGLVFASVAVAADDDPILHFFHGGTMDLDFELNSQLLAGPGVASGVVGGVAPAIADPFSALRNPAGMRYIRQNARFGIVFHPKAGASFGQFPFDTQTAINDAIDEFVAEFQTTDDFGYPEFGGSVVRTPSALSAFAITMPMSEWRFGFGYDRPFHFKFDMRHAGLRQRMDTVEDDPDEAVSFAMQARLNARVSADADRWALSVARNIGKNTTVGYSLVRYLVAIDINAGYNVDGLMTRGTQQYAFNNPIDPWYNNLHSEMVGGYEGSFWSHRLGFVFGSEDDSGWRLGGELVLNKEASLDGNLRLIIDEFPALKLDAEAGEDPFDVNRIEDVTEITRTYPNEYRPADELDLYIPSYWSVALSKGSGTRPNLSFKKYFSGKFGFDLAMQEKSVSDEEYHDAVYGRGIEPMYAGYAGIHPGWFIFGVGATVGKDFLSGYKDDGGNLIKAGKQIIIPRFDMGLSFAINSHLRYELMITGLPEDVLRMGVMYEF